MSAQEPVNIEVTPQNKGVTLTLELTLYDNGLVQLDGIPHESLAGAYIQIAHKVYELERRGRKRVSPGDE